MLSNKKGQLVLMGYLSHTSKILYSDSDETNYHTTYFMPHNL